MPESQTANSVIESREASHGDYLLQSYMAISIKDIFRKQAGYSKLSADQRESLDMIAVKMSRILHGNCDEPDHWLDIAGYATLCYNRLQPGETK
jgi:hypothetical protein